MTLPTTMSRIDTKFTWLELICLHFRITTDIIWYQVTLLDWRFSLLMLQFIPKQITMPILVLSKYLA